MPPELEPRYDHQKVESKWYDTWEKGGFFRPDSAPADAPPGKKTPAKKTAKKSTASKTPAGKKKKSFSIVIPPPNVTGQLHVGHALNHTIQDVLTRAARKRGMEALWVPGTDHAGIATQNRVERNLREEGRSRLDIGREAFVDKVWEWKEQSGSLITQQMRTMGLSVDWTRERFTMDEGLSRAVTKVFVQLFNEGLIVRGERIINWCPSLSCTTALANDEVNHNDVDGSLWHIKYPLKDGSGHIIVATTRPETMLGDTAVAVHPKDERYKGFHGKTILLPLMNREIPIVLDDHVDKEFGSGAVKVTPAHDPNDFEIARRHKLPMIRVMDDHAKINKEGGAYAGLDRFAARKKVVADLEAAGLLEKIEKHKHAVGHCYRCNQVIEPILSEQWFVRTQELAKGAIKAVEDGTIRFVPARWSNLYFEWMRNIQDWCISRQLWWGHRIPVFYCDSCTHHFASESVPDKCEKCGKSGLRQDPDVLDTWFSSALWPFSTMGWPDKTPDLAQFFPTTVLVTAYDIIFFWVARMIMMGLHVMKKEPFRDVYIHGIMRNEDRKKISKSLGNNIDPIEIVQTYGADAFRFFLMATLAEGKDSVYSEARLKGYQNFANKIWNSSRFLLMNLPETFHPDPAFLSGPLEAEDWWILHRLNETIREMEEALDSYRFHIAAESVYQFVWNNFCDWYIELIKPRTFGKVSEESADTARQTAFHILQSMLGLLHPIMPFITEEIYAVLAPYRKSAAKTGASAKSKDEADPLLIVSPWPTVVKIPAKAKGAIEGLELLQKIIAGARTIRAEAGIAPEKKVPLIVRTESKGFAALVKEKTQAVERLAQAASIRVESRYTPEQFDAFESFSEGEVYLPLAGVLDIEKEIQRLEKEKGELAGRTQGIQKKLDNPGFVANAPADVVEKEKERLTELQENIAKIEAALRRLIK